MTPVHPSKNIPAEVPHADPDMDTAEKPSS